MADLLTAGTEALWEAAFRTGDYAEADALLRGALDQVNGDRATEAAVLNLLGWLMHFQALDRGCDPTFADDEEALFRRALAIRRDIGDLGGVAGSLFGVGLVHQVLHDDFATAMPYFWEALELADEHADELTRSEVHRHVGFYHVFAAEQLDEGVRHLRISLDLRHSHGDDRWTPSGTLALGEAELARGNRTEAMKLLNEAVREARAARLSPRGIARAEDTLRAAESCT
ncbi:MAG TPA: hypothetical protein VFX16_32940 [Pseudonocardiaceae bacterium]|nr:hypothetical protein [Pseudonocardiaceae bacterium]